MCGCMPCQRCHGAGSRPSQASLHGRVVMMCRLCCLTCEHVLFLHCHSLRLCRTDTVPSQGQRNQFGRGHCAIILCFWGAGPLTCMCNMLVLATCKIVMFEFASKLTHSPDPLAMPSSPSTKLPVPLGDINPSNALGLDATTPPDDGQPPCTQQKPGLNMMHTEQMVPPVCFSV